MENGICKLLHLQRMHKTYHDKLIKSRCNICEGDHVLLYNSHLKLFPGKVKSHWFGPYCITQVLIHGAIEIMHPEHGTI